MKTFKQLFEQIDGNKVWKDFTSVSTNKPSKSDIKTLKYKENKKGVLVDWGDYKHLQGCQFSDGYFEKMGTDRAGFIQWLESQGVTKK